MIVAAAFLGFGIMSFGVAYGLTRRRTLGWWIAFVFLAVMLGLAMWVTRVVYVKDGPWEQAGTPAAYAILFALGVVLLLARRPTRHGRSAKSPLP